jgi:Domain of unknown function (DUF4136)
MAGIIVVLLGACQPEPDGALLYDELVVSTQFDPEAPFGEYTKFAIAKDTIGFVSNINRNDTIRVYSNDFTYPRSVIKAVKDTLISSMKFEEVDRDAADVGINIYVVADLNLYSQVVYPTYNNYYYGYSGYYYYPFVQTYAQRTATLVVEMVDLKNRDSQNRVKVVWNAYMGDVINSIDYEQQSVDAVKQAFKQSPYLFQE